MQNLIQCRFCKRPIIFGTEYCPLDCRSLAVALDQDKPKPGLQKPSPVDRALAVDGWMHESELIWLSRQAAGYRNIAEVGSWQGRSSIAIAGSTPGRLTCVDTWAGTPGEQAHKDLLLDKPERWLLERFLENTRDLANITPVRSKSVRFADSIQRPVFDMVFLDGAHDEASLRADIFAWRRLLLPGGLLCGHDYNWGSVKTVVDGIYPQAKRGPISIWWVDAL